MYNRIFAAPSQLVSDSEKKKEKWQRDTIDAFESLVLFENRQIKNSYYNKVTNYNLKRGILNMNDMERVVDPHGLGLGTFPGRMEHKGIGNSKIDLLVGEHIKRKFDFRVIRNSSDQEGINSIEEEKTKRIAEILEKEITSSNFDEREAQKRIKKVMDFVNSPFFDIAERGANKIIKFLYKYYNVKDLVFDNAFEDALIAAEQYCFIEELGGEILIRKGDPTRIFTIMNGHANDESGLEALVEVTYHTVSSIVDLFHDELTESQLKILEDYRGYNSGPAPYFNYPMYGHVGELAIPTDSATARIQELMPLGDLDLPMFSSYFDARGNIRLMHCIWRSKRKVKVLKKLNELGIEEIEWVHQKYQPDPSKGESILREEWINEWWRGYKIGAEIYVKIQPIPYLGNSLDNISKQTPPVVVQFYNTNSSRAQSLMDIVKPYDYLYNIFDYKRQILVNLMLPDIVQFPTSMIPDNMTLHEFLNYVTSTAFMPMDPTADVMTPKGLQSAGTFNTITPTRLNSTQSGPIQVLNNVLDNIVRTMDIVSGITQQRQGAISTSELVGNVERAVNQSSLTTEKWFARNEFFKIRCLRRMLDIGLNILRKNPKKLNYLLDDFTKEVITSEELESALLADFDLIASKSSDDAALMQLIEQNFQNSINAGTADISDLISVIKTESVQDAARILKNRRDERQQMEAEREEKVLKVKQEEIQAKKELEMQKLAIEQEKLNIEREKLILEKYKIDANNQTELQKATINTYAKREEIDLNNNQIPDPIELEKMYQKDREIDSKRLDKQLEISNKYRIEQEKLNLEKQKLTQEEKLVKLKGQIQERIEKLKLKNPVAGEKIKSKSK
jgi:hypothetical protein